MKQFLQRNQVFIAAIGAILLIMVLSGCADQHTRHVVDTVEVKVPVLERAAAPAELFRHAQTPIPTPVWVSPQTAGASVCLTSEGEAQLKSLLLRDESLLDGWERYGTVDR